MLMGRMTNFYPLRVCPLSYLDYFICLLTIIMECGTTKKFPQNYLSSSLSPIR